MEPGDILLFKAERDLLSKIIAWGTDSKYSHVAVCVSTGLDIAIEAMTRGGVRARAISKIPQDYDIYRVKEGYAYDLGKVFAFLVKSLNSRYDYKGVIYLGLLKLMVKFFNVKKDLPNKWQRSKDYFCSELCYEAFEHGGLDIVPQVPGADITSPGDIARSPVIEKVMP